MSSKQVWSWHRVVGALLFSERGEALEVQGVKVLILLCDFFLLSVTPASQQDLLRFLIY
jgi:hypothetical protein